MSTLREAPVSDFVYSSLSFFAPLHDGRLPARWFTESLGALGIEEQAVRQTLFRLERGGVLVGSRQGRMKWYAAASATEGILAAGRARVSTPSADEWDGNWTIVHFRIGEDDRERRDRIRDLLLVEGFAALGPGMYVQARDRSAVILAGAEALGVADRVRVFRGPMIGGQPTERFVLDLWDLAALGSRYRRFVKRYQPIAAAPASRWSPREAFALRFAFMFEFFRITWDDPALPPMLLPAEWPGERARAIAFRLTEKLRARAIAFAEDVYDAVSGGRTAHSHRAPRA